MPKICTHKKISKECAEKGAVKGAATTRFSAEKGKESAELDEPDEPPMCPYPTLALDADDSSM